MKTIINICCLIVFINQCGFSCKNYYDYINNDDNIAKIVSNDIQRNINIVDLENHKIILINAKDIKKGNSNLVNKVIICNGKILNNEKLIPGDYYKVIIKKPNNKRTFEKLINNNKTENTINTEEDIDVLASFRLNQIMKSFENSNKNEKKENIRDWREEYWVDVESSELDTTENNIKEYKNKYNQVINNNYSNEQSTLSNSLQSKNKLYENIQVLDESIQIKLDKLNKIHEEFAIKNGCVL